MMVNGPQLCKGPGLGLFLPAQNSPMRKNCSWHNVCKASFSTSPEALLGCRGSRWEGEEGGE